ncbi:MAG TPA: response regulator transcription factor [Alphaproteobacteria bacterium]|nr:response regulator transcription factor [Alphaproteobacteria bacterium]
MKAAPLSPAHRILIVDDEPHIRKFLRLSLQAEMYNVLEAGTAEEAITLVHSAKPDLIVLDLGLPDIDGRQVIRDVRLTSDMPIVVLSGRTEDSEKIAVLEQGADDYITKPFAMKDLVTRVRASLEQRSVRHEHFGSDKVHTGNLSIALHARDVRCGNKPVLLEDEEYELLRLLAMHGGRVLTLNRIEKALWGKEGDEEHHRHVQRRIRGLRRKLESEPSFPRYIVTEPSVGYRLEMLPPESLHS